MHQLGSYNVRDGSFRSGDVVEVRSAAEILATLDEWGAMAALPFMPEMLQHCGRRFTVLRRVEKVCDTIHYNGSRRLRDTILLDDLRCDGSGHDGCEAECRLLWKEAWVRRVGEDAPLPGAIHEADQAALDEILARGARRAGGADGALAYRCQATELLRASEPLRLRDPRQYAREVTSGNISIGRFVRVMARAVRDEVRNKLHMYPKIPLVGKRDKVEAEPELGLRPGEWVQVKTVAEIAERLTRKGTNRGLWFDREMLPHCGRTYRVRRRVSRIVDEATGRMIVMKNECVTLEGVVCSGELSLGRWFCPRGIYPYWRESWLRRVCGPAEETGDASPLVELGPTGEGRQGRGERG